MLLIAGAFFCLLLMDPFGIETASSRRSEQAALRVTAPFYASSGEVVVVLIDDDYLARLGKGWPLPYADQGRLLRTVFQAAPSAVFLDILYRQKHDARTDAAGEEPADDPMNLLAPVSSFTDTTLVFAAQIRSGLRTDLLPSLCPEKPVADTLGLEDPASLLPEFRTWRDSRGHQARVGLVGWWGCGERYPLRLGPTASGAVESTPAMALLEAYCANPAREQPGCALLREEQPADGHFTAPLVVRWGAFPPAQQRPFYSAGVCQPYADATGGVPWWQAVKTSLTQLLLGIFEDLRE